MQSLGVNGESGVEDWRQWALHAGLHAVAGLLRLPPDPKRILPTATPEEVRAHVRERLAIIKPGGGYVFNQIHNIQPNVPAENIIAMLDAAYEFGGAS